MRLFGTVEPDRRRDSISPSSSRTFDPCLGEAVVVGVAGSGHLGLVVEAGRDLSLQFGELGGGGRRILDAGLLELSSQPCPTFGDGTAFGLGGIDTLLKVFGLGTAELQSGPYGQVVFVDGRVRSHVWRGQR
jgi:hypothetical protein